MDRSLFLRIVGWFHVALGAAFFLFTREATTLMITDPAPNMDLLVKGLSGIVAAFGLMNLLVHREADGPAFRAILIGTLLYLVFTVLCDIRWVITGLLWPIAWATIGMRSVFAIGYVYYLVKLFGRS